MNARNAEAIADICRRLDGLPLAIELIAGYVSIFSLETILERLEQDARLLAGARQDSPSRHQTMQGAIEWSYDLLREEERILFTRLSVFVGGFTFEAAEAVCAGDDVSQSNLAAALRGLVNKSVVRRDCKNESRFTMLEVIREYGLERLAATGETGTLQQRHADFFCVLAERNDRPRSRGQTLASTLRAIECEIADLRAAMHWLVSSGEREMALRIATASRSFWKGQGLHEEGRRWLREASDGGTDFAPGVMARALTAEGHLASLQGQYDAATALLEESLTLSRQLSDPDATAESLMFLGNTCMRSGRPGDAIPLLEESLAIARETSDYDRIAAVLQGVHEYQPGQKLDAVLDPDNVFVFDAAGRLVASPGSA